MTYKWVICIGSVGYPAVFCDTICNRSSSQPLSPLTQRKVTDNIISTPQYNMMKEACIAYYCFISPEIPVELSSQGVQENPDHKNPTKNVNIFLLLLY